MSASPTPAPRASSGISRSSSSGGTRRPASPSSSSPSAAANRASGAASASTSPSRRTTEAAPAEKGAGAKKEDGFTPSEALKEEQQAPGEGEKKADAPDDKSAKVKLDSWKKGRNDCLEHALQAQGYSLKEIYSKGPDGKTLLQRESERNGIKDHRRIPDGKELNLTRKPGTVAADGLQAGQKLTREAQDAQGSMAVTAQKNLDGTKSAGTETNHVAEVSSGLTVPAGGAAHGTVQNTPQGLVSNVHGENARGDAKTDIQTVANPQGVSTTITDSDKSKNLRGVIDQNGVFAQNPGKVQGDNVDAGISHGPKSKLESAGSWLDQHINPWGPTIDPPKEFDGASQVNHVKRPDGSISVDATNADGSKTEWNRGADGFFQRNLRALSNWLLGGK